MPAKKKTTSPKPKGPQKIFVARDTRRYVKTFDEQVLLQARLSADCGQFDLLGDIFDNLLQKDAHHPGTLSAISEKALELDVCYNQDNSDEVTPVEEAAAQDFEHQNQQELHSLIGQGLSIGFVLVQLTPWKVNEAGRMVPTLKCWPVQAVNYDTRRRVWQIWTEGMSLVDVEIGTGQWALFTPYGTDRPWLKGTWRACADWCKSKVDARIDWDRQGETAAGIKTVKTPEGADNRDRRAAAQDLSNVGTDGVFVPPPLWEMDLFQASTSTYQTFEKKIETANKEISIANKGESFTAGEGGGGLAEGAGKTRKEVSDAKACFFAKALCDFFNEQILPIWTRENFADEKPPCAEIHEEPVEDLQALSDTWNKTAEAAAKLLALGFKLDLKKLAQKMKLPIVEDAMPQRIITPAPQGAATPTQTATPAE